MAKPETPNENAPPNGLNWGAGGTPAGAPINDNGTRPDPNGFFGGMTLQGAAPPGGVAPPPAAGADALDSLFQGNATAPAVRTEQSTLAVLNNWELADKPSVNEDSLAIGLPLEPPAPLGSLPAPKAPPPATSAAPPAAGLAAQPPTRKQVPSALKATALGMSAPKQLLERARAAAAAPPGLELDIPEADLSGSEPLDLPSLPGDLSPPQHPRSAPLELDDAPLPDVDQFAQTAMGLGPATDLPVGRRADTGGADDTLDIESAAPRKAKGKRRRSKKAKKAGPPAPPPPTFEKRPFLRRAMLLGGLVGVLGGGVVAALQGLFSPPPDMSAGAAPQTELSTPPVSAVPEQASAEPVAAAAPATKPAAPTPTPTAVAVPAPTPAVAPAPAKAAPAAPVPAPVAAKKPEPPAPMAKQPAPPEPAPDVEHMSADQIVRTARAALNGGDAARAESMLRDLLDRKPREHHAKEVLIEALLALDRGAEAVPLAQAIVKRRSKRASYRILLGDALAAAGNRSAAEEAWRVALEIDPGNSQAKRRLSP